MTQKFTTTTIRQIALMHFYPGAKLIKVKNEDVKKFKIGDYEKIIMHTRILSMMVAHGDFLGELINIRNDKSLSDENKLDIIQGEAEIFFKKQLDYAIQTRLIEKLDTSIDGIKKMYGIENGGISEK